MKTPQLQKIIAMLPGEEWHGHSSETLWAERVAEGRYRIRSVPFFAKELSFGDIVETRRHDGKDIVCGVSLRSGHSTYRIYVKPPVELDTDAFNGVWRKLQDLGCTYERATQHLIAVDVPAHADLPAAYSLLEAGEAAGVWEFEEGHSGGQGAKERTS